jgi:hypothetical protein
MVAGAPDSHRPARPGRIRTESTIKPVGRVGREPVAARGGVDGVDGARQRADVDQAVGVRGRSQSIGPGGEEAPPHPAGRGVDGVQEAVVAADDHEPVDRERAGPDPARRG